jgi:hypothetical protein
MDDGSVVKAEPRSQRRIRYKYKHRLLHSIIIFEQTEPSRPVSVAIVIYNNPKPPFQ